MLITNIYPLCWLSHYLYVCWSIEGLPSLSDEKQRSLISGVARSCSSLTTHDMFSHVHIRLILNVQQHCFFVCLKMAPWMQPGLRDHPVVLRPRVDDYQTSEMADRPSDLQDPVWWNKGPSWYLKQKICQWFIKPPEWLMKIHMRTTADGLLSFYDPEWIWSSRTTGYPGQMRATAGSVWKLMSWWTTWFNIPLDLQEWTTGSLGHLIDCWTSGLWQKSCSASFSQGPGSQHD